jgi:hypothetical protein
MVKGVAHSLACAAALSCKASLQLLWSNLLVTYCVIMFDQVGPTSCSIWLKCRWLQCKVLTASTPCQGLC